MNRLSHLVRAVAVVTLLIAACASKPPAATTAAAAAPAAAGSVVTLKDLQNGDRACYVVVVDAGGAERSIEGDFELCPGASKDASALIGQRVTVTTEKANVLAAACEGDVDCGKSDEVDLITTITAAP